jgi:hypothetical protein
MPCIFAVVDIGINPNIPGSSYKHSFYLPYKEKKDKKRDGMKVAIIVVLASWKWKVDPNK